MNKNTYGSFESSDQLLVSGYDSRNRLEIQNNNAVIGYVNSSEAYFANLLPTSVGLTSSIIGHLSGLDQSLSTSSTVQFSNLTIQGDLTVAGTQFINSASSITTEDNILLLASNNTADVIDTGFAALYNDGVNKYRGLICDVSTTDNRFKLFEGTTSLPVSTADTSDLANLELYDLFCNDATINSVSFNSFYTSTNSSIATNAADITANYISITANAAYILTNQNNIATNAQAIGENTDAIASNLAAIGSLQTDLTALTTDVNGFPDQLKSFTSYQLTQMLLISTSSYTSLVNMNSAYGIISSANWIRLYQLDQGLATADTVVFNNATIDGELISTLRGRVTTNTTNISTNTTTISNYLNQAVKTTSQPTFTATTTNDGGYSMFLSNSSTGGAGIRMTNSVITTNPWQMFVAKTTGYFKIGRGALWDALTIDLSGNISVRGTVDGVDLAQLKTDFDALPSYEEATASSTFTNGAYTGSTIAVNFKLVRLGDRVSFSWSWAIEAGNGSTGAVIDSGYTIPAAFRPAATVYLPVKIIDADVDGIGFMDITSAGVITVRTLAGAFNATSGLTGIYTGCVSYNI